MLSLLRIKELEKYDLDDPLRTLLHRKIIMEKPFLRKLYEEWYSEFTSASKEYENPVMIELGAGGGFLKEILPDVITSDIMELPNCERVISALDIPFGDESIDAIFMVDVFHHIPDSRKFLQEASRVLKKGGRIVMVEPANSFWSRLIFKNLHHEPFEEKGDWTIPSSGPLSGANGALPYIVFERDKDRFEKEFPLLEIKKIKKHTPLRYLLSGGVSFKQLVPSWSFGFITFIEKLLSPVSSVFSMFETIVIEKK